MNIPTFLDLWLVVPFLIVLITSIFCLSSKLWSWKRSQDSFVIFWQALFGVGFALAFLVFLKSSFPDSTLIFSDTLVFDGLSYYGSVFILFIVVGVLCLSQGHPALKQQFIEHLFLILNAVIGLWILIWSNHLIVSFVGIELMSLAFYLLAGLSLEQKLSKEAAFKYFILGSLASAILLYGIALIYGSVNSLLISDFVQASSFLMEDPLFLIGLILLICGLFFKISLFPFHAWTADVYQGSPTPVTAFLSTAGKLAPFVLLLRVAATGVFASSVTLMDLMQWLAVLTMLVGNIAALRQTNLKRILAYSSVAHSGYIMLGVIALSLDSSQGMGAAGVLFYFLAYSLMNIGAFAFVCLLESSEQTLVTMDSIKGLSYKRPYMALALAVCLLSLAGIPPTAGFFGKFYIFAAALNQGLVWLVVWAVINSVISIYYYLRPILYIYMMEPDKSVKVHPDILVKYLLLSSASLILILGIFADGVVRQIATAMSVVFQ